MDILTEPLPWRALRIFVELLLLQKRDVVDKTPVDPDPEGSGMDLGNGMSQIMSQSCVVTSNHRHDLI